MPREGSTMADQKATAPTAEFKIPLELLKTFQSDVRFIPVDPHHYGYITFDAAMLKAVLLSGDPAVRAKLAEQLDALNRAGGELVIMSR
jgi:hypothetical protein